jgi:hypothetical protein
MNTLTVISHSLTEYEKDKLKTHMRIMWDVTHGNTSGFEKWLKT